MSGSKLVNLPACNPAQIKHTRYMEGSQSTDIGVELSFILELQKSFKLLHVFLWSIGRKEQLFGMERVNNSIKVSYSGHLTPIHRGSCIAEEFAHSQNDIRNELETDIIPTRRKYLIEKTDTDFLYHNIYYVAVYGKDHPYNHISRTYFADSIEVNRKSAMHNFVDNGFNHNLKYNPITTAQEPNRELPLPPMTFKERLEALDQFIEKKLIERNNSNNTHRLKKYLKQSILWYHGKKVPFWKTTAEYRHRWKNHLDWIIASPVLNEEIKLSKDPDVENNCIVLKPTGDIIFKKEVEKITKFYHEPAMEKSLVSATPQEGKKDPKLKIITPCTCGYTHTNGFRSEQYRRMALNWFGMYKVEVGSPFPSNVELHPMFGRNWTIATKTVKEKHIPQLTVKDIVTENRYAVLGEEKNLREPMPIFLSPLSEDHSRDFPWTDALKRRTKKQERLKIKVKTKKTSDTIKVLKAKKENYRYKAKKLINPQMTNPYKCQLRYTRRIGSYGLIPLDTILQKYKITKELICSIFNIKLFRKYLDIDSSEEMEMFKNLKRLPYTRKQGRIIQSLFRTKVS